MTKTIKASSAKSFSEIREQIKTMSPAVIAEAAATDSITSFPAQTFAGLAAAGLPEAVVSAKAGGAGLGTKPGTTLQLLKILKRLGYGNLVVGRIFEGHFNAWQLIEEYAKPGQLEKLQSSPNWRNSLSGVWNTEAADGVKINSKDKGKYVLEGAKTFASGVGYVTRPVVTGRLPDGGWQMFIVPLDEVETSADDSWWKPLGMQATRSFRVDFTGVEITENDFIGAANDYYRQPFFSGGAIRFAAVQLGAAELLFDLTREFLRELKRTEDPFQQMRLGEMAMAVESGNLWLRNAARKFDDYLREKDESQIEKVIHYAGMMRTAIEEICQRVVTHCTRSIGSRGLLRPYHFERVIRDLTTYLRQAAPDATLTGIGGYVLKTTENDDELWARDDD